MSVCTLAAASVLFADPAAAQRAGEVVVVHPETIPEAVNRTFFRNSPNFYVNRGVIEQIDSLLGVGVVSNGFIENEIASDGRALSALMQDLLRQQANDSPLIRTADLVNPYETSLQLQPVVPTERFDPAPPYSPPIIRQQPSAAPVPGLW
ncbi:MAG: hypothetical protein EA367_02165 [Leptolyngbya sp. DLM2.Bin15]|nr:MAG: hypothetical protein EA367_02165 [Leptolyngbya sp. DLM2.Bin15]